MDVKGEDFFLFVFYLHFIAVVGYLKEQRMETVEAGRMSLCALRACAWVCVRHEVHAKGEIGK